MPAGAERHAGPVDDTAPERWSWDASLYSGAAAYYVRGRVPYPAALVALLVDELGLDGRGRLLDLGCGPGSLTLPLAPHVSRAIGVDADAGMLHEAGRQARLLGVGNVTWLHHRAEDLSPELGPFEVVTLAQSFHWMDRPRVAALVRTVLAEDGALAFVHATTHQGIEPTAPLRWPRPPRAEIEALVTTFLGPRRRAGAGHRREDPDPEGVTGAVESTVFRAAGLVGPVRHVLPGRVVERTSDDVVASVFSLSYAAPHLLGDRREAFEGRLRDLLHQTSPGGLFSEQMREIVVDLWRVAR